MIKRKHIKAYVKKLTEEFNPERVILFGSYARGNPTRDSDVDLLVIMDHDRRKNVEQAINIDRKINYTFPLDLLVRKPAEIDRRLAASDFFLLSILKEGQVLYERRRQRVAGEGRRRLHNGFARMARAKVAQL